MKTLGLFLLVFAGLSPAHAAEAGSFSGISSIKSEPAGFFRLGRTRNHDHFITPDDYIDRPASFGCGLRQGLLKAGGAPRETFIRCYREAFAAALRHLEELAP